MISKDVVLELLKKPQVVSSDGMEFEIKDYLEICPSLNSKFLTVSFKLFLLQNSST
jgi:proline dehydrogenase